MTMQAREFVRALCIGGAIESHGSNGPVRTFHGVYGKFSAHHVKPIRKTASTPARMQCFSNGSWSAAVRRADKLLLLLLSLLWLKERYA